MEFNWSTVKEIFYTVGSIAGTLALLRPIVESKFQRDITRAERIKGLINEQSLVDLENRIYASRRVRREEFEPFAQLADERRYNQEGVRFTGPLAKYFLQELDNMLASYAKLREYIQVDAWEPEVIDEDGVKLHYWKFNKARFFRQDYDGISYVVHLDAAAAQAVEIRKAFQRFQLVTELHIFEVPLAWWLFPRRFKAHQLLKDS